MPHLPLLLAAAASGASLILWELLLARVFAVVLFADLAHLALGAAMMGLTLGALAESRAQPAEGEALKRRVAILLGLQGLAIVLTVVLALHLPLLADDQSGSFYIRDPMRFELLNGGAYLVLNLALPLPAAAGGALMAALLRQPRLAAPAYAADLGAAGLMAALFLPLCEVWAAPDLALLAAALAFGGAAALRPRVGGALAVATGLAALIAGGRPLLTVDRAAGWAESGVFAERWTQTARYSLFLREQGHAGPENWLLVDNGSASQVVTTEAQAEHLSGFPNRGLVHTLHGPGRVAVPASGAGPEVAVALHHGHTEVVAVELDAAMFALVEEHFPGASPYADPRVRTVALDGRAALLREEEPFDIVHLMWANFFGAAGRIQAAWTPQLLYTQEALDTWLRVLKPDGTVSMAGPNLAVLEATARSTLAARGVVKPEDHFIAARDGASGVVLVKKRAFTQAERTQAAQWLRAHRTPSPRRGPPPGGLKAALTDDRPYPDRLSTLLHDLRMRRDGSLPEVYRTLGWGMGLTLGGLGLVLAAAFGRRRPRKAFTELTLAGCLGYGYLALQVVLIHQVVLYVGHPALAFATVLGAMLVGSGLGGLWSARSAPADLARRMRQGLLGVVLLGGALVLALRLLGPLLLPAPTVIRVGAVALGVGAVGFAAGLPMPSAIRLRAGDRPRLAPLMWAVNGWASVLAATLAVLLARMAGYTVALGIACAAYGLALVVTARWRPEAG